MGYFVKIVFSVIAAVTILVAIGLAVVFGGFGTIIAQMFG